MVESSATCKIYMEIPQLPPTLEVTKSLPNLLYNNDMLLGHDLMRELQAGGTTMILATHDMAEAEKMADRVAILLQGRIVAIQILFFDLGSGEGLDIFR